MWENLNNGDYIYSGKLVEYGQPVEGTINWEINDIIIKKDKNLSGLIFYVKNPTYGKYKFYLPSWKLKDNLPHAVYFSNEDNIKKYLTIVSL